MTPEDIKIWGAKVTEKFLNDSIPLDKSIAEVAMTHSLTENQIKRLVEAVNQITYLKLHSLVEAKTFEFSVASLEGVKKLLYVKPAIEKAAEAKVGKVSPLEFVASMEKAAEAYVPPPTVPQEAELRVYSQMLKEACSRLEDECQIQISALEDQRRVVATDPLAMEKVACTKYARELSRFLGLEKKASEDHLFSKKEMEEVEKLASLYDNLRGLHSKLMGTRTRLGTVDKVLGKGIFSPVTAAFGAGKAVGSLAAKAGLMDTGVALTSMGSMKPKGPTINEQLYGNGSKQPFTETFQRGREMMKGFHDISEMAEDF